MEDIMKLLRKLKIQLLYDPVMLFLSLSPKKMKSTWQRGICTPIFIAELLIVSQDMK
jgi:hypothetical protein